jgi:hypothetical protein
MPEKYVLVGQIEATDKAELSQSMECFLAANRHALEYYGASPRRPCMTILRPLC